MVKLYGKEYTKEELLLKAGDISQLGGVRLSSLQEGKEQGVRTADFRTGSGFDFTVVIDRALDISLAEYKGQPLAFRSSTGETAPAYYEAEGTGWLRSFFGGLMVTCGLTQVGSPNVDDGEDLGIHGRISNIPATNVYADGEWQEDGSYEMWVQGKMRETILFGANIEMARRISAKLGESRLFIHDKVTNLGFEEKPHMILYHINAGFPVVDNGSRFVAPTSELIPRDADATDGEEDHAVFSDPIPGFYEKVYYHEMAEDADGNVTVALINSGFNNGKGLGFYLKYSKKELPRFIQWKNMGQGIYVVGMEPANCWVGGRAAERANGTLQFLKPGETREYHLEIGVLSSQDEIKAFEDSVKSVLGK